MLHLQNQEEKEAAIPSLLPSSLLSLALTITHGYITKSSSTDTFFKGLLKRQTRHPPYRRLDIAETSDTTTKDSLGSSKEPLLLFVSDYAVVRE